MLYHLKLCRKAPSPFSPSGEKRRFHSESVWHFSVHTTAQKSENAAITGHFGFIFEENLGKRNHMIIVASSFSKSSVFKMLSVPDETEGHHFQTPSVWIAFSKSFRDRLVWTVGRPNRRNKGAFSNFSGVLWTGSKTVSIIILSLENDVLATSKHCVKLSR